MVDPLPKDLPADMIIHYKIVISRKSGEAVIRMINNRALSPVSPFSV